MEKQKTSKFVPVRKEPESKPETGVKHPQPQQQVYLPPPPPVYIPMPTEEKRKLFKEFQEDMKQQITQISNLVAEKALEPIKRNLRSIETDMVVENKKIV